jgi:hypothetical protein
MIWNPPRGFNFTVFVAPGDDAAFHKAGEPLEIHLRSLGKAKAKGLRDPVDVPVYVVERWKKTSEEPYEA